MMTLRNFVTADSSIPDLNNFHFPSVDRACDIPHENNHSVIFVFFFFKNSFEKSEKKNRLGRYIIIRLIPHQLPVG